MSALAVVGARVRFRCHRALGGLWWAAHRLVEAPLYWIPRTGRGERAYDLLWPVLGRSGQWCVTRALRHYRRAGRAADALGEPPTDELREAFCEDVLSQLGPEWRLRRGAVLRWALGWGVQHGKVGELPDILRALPPVGHEGFESRPQHVRDASEHERKASEAG